MAQIPYPRDPDDSENDPDIRDYLGDQRRGTHDDASSGFYNPRNGGSRGGGGGTGGGKKGCLIEALAMPPAIGVTLIGLYKLMKRSR